MTVVTSTAENVLVLGVDSGLPVLDGWHAFGVTWDGETTKVWIDGVRFTGEAARLMRRAQYRNRGGRAALRRLRRMGFTMTWRTHPR